jgi:hypothetical protein
MKGYIWLFPLFILISSAYALDVGYNNVDAVAVVIGQSRTTAYMNSFQSGTFYADAFCFNNGICLNTTSGGSITNETDPNYFSNPLGYINSTLQLSSSVYAGTDLSGSDGTVNRELTFAHTPVTVVVDSFTAIKDRDYSYAAGTITFIGKKWNDQDIEVWYYE